MIKLLKNPTTLVVWSVKTFGLAIVLTCPTAVMATPSAYVVENNLTPEKKTWQFLGQMRDPDDNPTGIATDSQIPGKVTLKDDIIAVLPYLEDVLKDAWSQAEDQVKSEIKAHGWDYEYTMQSFYDFGNPYSNIDYHALIAAYATIVSLGRNDMPLLSDVPFLITDIQDTKIDDTHSYGTVSMKMLDIDGLCRYYGYDPEDPDFKAIYTSRLQKIKDAMTERDIKQTIFTETPEVLQSTIDTVDTDDLDDYGINDEDVSDDIRYVLLAACSLQGKIPYDWGGKASKPGYDTTWWTYDESDGRQRGLDCSGFVQWAFMTAGYPKSATDKLISTYTMREELQDISADELEPGDIGLLKNDDNGTNHCGIYLGDGMWIHCTSSKHTVVINDYGFRYFKKAPEGSSDPNIVNKYLSSLQSAGNTDDTDTADSGAYAATEEDVLTLAQLIEHEVGGEGYNAWVAVGEVVLNRINSTQFKENTLHDVVYAPHQFSYVHEIKYINPRSEVVEVAREILAGELKYFDNPNVLFFRNPTITSGIPSTDPVDWGKLPWYAAVGATAFYLGS
jgi:hypothetical protein